MNYLCNCQRFNVCSENNFGDGEGDRGGNKDGDAFGAFHGDGNAFGDPNVSKLSHICLPSTHPKIPMFPNLATIVTERN